MDIRRYRSHYKTRFLERPEAEEAYPFGEDVAVYKIRGKMFGLFSLMGEQPIMNLKCDPDQALALRDIFPSIIEGYHMNKKHWNTIILDGSVPEVEIERLIDHSYALVVKGLKKTERQALISLYGEQIVQN